MIKKLYSKELQTKLKNIINSIWSMNWVSTTLSGKDVWFYLTFATSRCRNCHHLCLTKEERSTEKCHRMPMSREAGTWPQLGVWHTLLLPSSRVNRTLSSPDVFTPISPGSRAVNEAGGRMGKDHASGLGAKHGPGSTWCTFLLFQLCRTSSLFIFSLLKLIIWFHTSASFSLLDKFKGSTALASAQWDLFFTLKWP